MKIVGLTGGIACGKSTVSAMLRDAHGLPVVDADEIAKAALDIGAPAYHKVVAAFGDSILEPVVQTASSAGGVDAVCLPRIGSRPIDRKKLGEIVFNDVVQRRKLNGIISPYIGKSMAWECLKHFAVGTAVLVLDVPLLYETVANLTTARLPCLIWLPSVAVTVKAETHLCVPLQGVHRICSEVVVVNVSPDVQLERLTRRDGTTEREATSRINAQMPLADKVQRADIIIDNDGTEVDLFRKVAGYGEMCTRRLLATLAAVLSLAGLVALLLTNHWLYTCGSAEAIHSHNYLPMRIQWTCPVCGPAASVHSSMVCQITPSCVLQRKK